MRQFRHSYKAALTLVGASVALVIGCSESVDPSIHGAPAVMVGPATQIQVAPTSTALNQGGRSLLRCVAFDAQGVMLSNAPSWTSSDPATAIVSSDGSVTAIHAGTATATCQIGSRTAMSSITVSTAQVAFVEVSPGAGTIAPGTTLQFSGVPRDSLGFPVPGVSVQWTSQDPTIATVTSDGVVTARTTGDADIVATSAGVAGMTKVKVTGVTPPPVASILLSVDQTSLSAGHFTFATATTLDANGQPLVGRAITWSTGDPTVLSAVVLNGTKAKVNARAQGTAAITATSEGKNATVTINVGAPTVAVVAASLASSSIVVGQTTLASAIPEDGFGNPLSGHAVTWTSLDPTIATVSSSGVVTGVAPGAVIIRATSDGVTGDASLTVTAVPVASVTTTLSSSTLTVGQTTQGTAIARDAGGNMLTGRSVAWSSLNTAVATVSISGLVTAIAPGNAVIRATVESKTGDATVVVNAPAAPVCRRRRRAWWSPSIRRALRRAIHRRRRPRRGTGRATFCPASPRRGSPRPRGVASVSGTGVVTGTNAGTAVIQATIDGVSGSGSLAVTSGGSVTPPTTATVAVFFDSASIAVGHTSQAKAVAKDASGNLIAGKTATFLSKTTGIASVGSSSGVVMGLSAGTATIQATIDGVSARVTARDPCERHYCSAPSGTVASANFEDGTLGSFYNPWSGSVQGAVDVTADPTSRAQGKVVRIHYANNPPGNYDSNLALFNSTAVITGLGQTMWYQGDFYIDNTGATADVMRKLIYWWTDASSFVITLQPRGDINNQQLQVTPNQNHPETVFYTPVIVSTKTWHRLKVQLQMNSSVGSTDGVLNVWMDGALAYSRNTLTWIEATNATDKGFSSYASGYQGQNNTGFNEYRYWDNVILSRSPIP